MKRLADRGKKPWRGTLYPCKRCGLVVVHADKTGLPFHMHRHSALCARLARRRGVLSMQRAMLTSPIVHIEVEPMTFTPWGLKAAPWYAQARAELRNARRALTDAEAAMFLALALDSRDRARRARRELARGLGAGRPGQRVSELLEVVAVHQHGPPTARVRCDCGSVREVRRWPRQIARARTCPECRVVGLRAQVRRSCRDFDRRPLYVRALEGRSAAIGAGDHAPPGRLAREGDRR